MADALPVGTLRIPSVELNVPPAPAAICASAVRSPEAAISQRPEDAAARAAEAVGAGIVFSSPAGALMRALVEAPGETSGEALAAAGARANAAAIATTPGRTRARVVVPGTKESGAR